MPSRDEMLENQDMIDEEVFIQLIELDEDGSTEFLSGVAAEWFEQAVDTFKSMDEALEESELDKFSKLAHFLKGSSGQLGIKTLQGSCSTLQHLGEQWDEEKDKAREKILSEDEAVKRIKPILARAKKEYAEAEKWLNAYLAGDDADGESVPDDLQSPKVEATQKEKDVRAKDEKKTVQPVKAPVAVKA